MIVDMYGREIRIGDTVKIQNQGGRGHRIAHIVKIKTDIRSRQNPTQLTTLILPEDQTCHFHYYRNPLISWMNLDSRRIEILSRFDGNVEKLISDCDRAKRKEF